MLNIVVPMAGRGSRFANEGYADPKPLIQVHDKRMIEVVVNNLTPKCLHRFIFICQKEHLLKYDYEAKLKKIAPNCIVIPIDSITDGAACTVMMAEKYINNNDPLMIANSDQWVDIDINDYLSFMENNHLDGLIMTMNANDPKWSYTKIDDSGFVVSVVEKKVVSDEATVGIYNFKSGTSFCTNAKKMFDENERSNGEFYVAPVYTKMYENDGSNIRVYNIGKEASGMYGLGTPSDLKLFLSLDISIKATSF